MSNIKVIIDALCDVRNDVKNKYGIVQLPYLFTVDNTEYLSSDVTSEEVIKMYSENKKITTSRPSLGIWQEILEKELSNGHDILFISSTIKMTGSYNSFKVMEELLKSKYTERKIYSTDTVFTGACTGIIVEKACKYLESHDIEKTIDYVKYLNTKVNCFACFSSTKSIIDNNRYDGKVQTNVLANYTDGVFNVLNKFNSEIDTINYIEKSYSEKNIAETYLYVSTDASIEYIKIFKDKFDIKNTFVVGPTMQTYSPSGSVGIVYIEK